MSEIATANFVGQQTNRIKKHDFIFLPVIRLFPKSVTPNHLSITRMLLVLPIILLMWLHFFKLCGFLYLIAAIIDALDGSMARLRNQETKLGAFLDPAADKAVNFSVFLGFLFYIKSNTYIWMIAPILFIDLILFQISLLKYIVHILPENHKVRSYVEITKTGANSWGKTKMVTQVIILTMLLIFNPQTILWQSPLWAHEFNILSISYPMLAICSLFSVMSLIGHIKVIKLKPKG